MKKYSVQVTVYPEDFEVEAHNLEEAKEQYKCPGCGKPVPKKNRALPYWMRPEHSYEPFCRMRCAVNYAQALYDHTGLITYKQNTA